MKVLLFKHDVLEDSKHMDRVKCFSMKTELSKQQMLKMHAPLFQNTFTQAIENDVVPGD